MKSSVIVAGLLALSLVACGGGGGALPSGGGGGGSTPAPAASPTLPPTSSQTASLGSAPTSFSLGQISSGASAQLTMPAIGSGSASATLTLMGSLPAGVPTPSAQRVHKMLQRDSLGGTVTPIAYVEFTLTASATISQTPAATLTFPAGRLNGYAYAALYDPTQASAGWNAIAGPMGPYTAAATSVTFPAGAITPPITLAPNVNYIIAIVETGTPLPTPTPVPTATPTPAATATPTGAPTATPTPMTGATPAVVQGPGTPLTGNTKFGVGWAPYGVASALDFPVQHGWNGSGQSVAIVIDSDVNRADIQTYVSEFGIPMPAITTISVDGASGVVTNGDQVEAYLDVETVAGLAPGAHIYIYDMPDLSDQSIADAYSKIDSDGLVQVANSSFGGCETPALPEDPFIAQGTKAGITFVASAGDSGNVCDSVSQVGASWPASNPNVVAAGGTETRYTIASTAVWNDTACGSQCGGGGGVSSIYTLPAYQNGLAGASSTAYRNEPDISLPAEDVSVRYDATWGQLLGTSWSSPEYAALMAEVLQYCQLSTGLANPVNVPYYVASRYPKAYLDVVGGNDQFAGTTPFYAAAVGYDNASGFGVPYGMAYANTACPARTKASGLLARAAAFSPASQSHVGAEPLDVTPRVNGLIDRGRRSKIAMTPVQIVLLSDADRAAVEEALEQAGFTIDRRYTYREIVHAQAPSQTVERYFSTQLHDVLQMRYGMRYMPATRVAVPQSIAPYVRTVNMDNVVTRHVLSAVPAGIL